MTVTVESAPLGDMEALVNRFPDIKRRALSLAINDSARFAKRIASEQIRREIAFPPGYLEQNERLSVKTFASPDRLTAAIAGRGRATSLLRFAKGSPTVESTRGRNGRQKGTNATGVDFMVVPGRTSRISGAFVVRLNAGKSFTQDNYNLGVAVKAENGGFPIYLNKYKVVQQAGKAFYVLYGPSVAQAFEIVAPKVAPEVASKMADEFMRQFARLANGR